MRLPWPAARMTTDNGIAAIVPEPPFRHGARDSRDLPLRAQGCYTVGPGIGQPLRWSGNMATKLEKPLRREFPVNEELYTLTISPEGLKLVPKGKRKGHELTWRDLLNGQPAVASAPASPMDPS